MKVGVEKLAGKRCLITGAASELGRSTAQLYVEPAYRLVMRLMNRELDRAVR